MRTALALALAGLLSTAAAAQTAAPAAPKLPAAVPLYPGASVVEQEVDADGDMDVTLRTGASVAQVRAFYEKSMRDAGAQPTTRSLFAGSATVRGRDAANRYEVDIEREGNMTEIDIEVDRRP